MLYLLDIDTRSTFEHLYDRKEALLTSRIIHQSEYPYPHLNDRPVASRFEDLTRTFCAIGERQGDDFIVPGEFDLSTPLLDIFVKLNRLIIGRSMRSS